MIDPGVFAKLHAEGLLSDASYNKIAERKKTHVLSIHWEVKTVLYLGILLLTTGFGVVVYKNIDTIGHQVILAFIALVSISCFTYCFRFKVPFDRDRVKSPTTFFDYILLLGTLSLLIFMGYLQFKYNVFGTNYGMATFIPMLLLFYIAYNFDHVGILNMAIVNLGVWMGITATPRELLSAHTFNSQHLINTYTIFGLLLLAAAWLTSRYKVKPHFKFSYAHYGTYTSLTALLAGYFLNYENAICWLWMLGLLILALRIGYDAFKNSSFYFLLIACIYGYTGISSIIVRGLLNLPNGGGIWFLFYYFIFSAIGGIYGLINLHKKMRHDHL